MNTQLTKVSNPVRVAAKDENGSVPNDRLPIFGHHGAERLAFRSEGLIDTRCDGKQPFYSISSPAAKVVTQTINYFASQKHHECRLAQLHSLVIPCRRRIDWPGGQSIRRRQRTYPGPAVAILLPGRWHVIVFMSAMLAGMLLFTALEARRSH